MKLVLLSIFWLLIIFNNVHGQLHHDKPGPRAPGVYVVVLPKLSPNAKVAEHIKAYVNLEDLINTLKKESADGWGYVFFFDIDVNGKLIGGKYDPVPLAQPLNEYVKKKFIHYTWKPGFKKDEISKKVKQSGLLSVFFDLTKKEVDVKIRFINQRMREIYARQIVIN